MATVSAAVCSITVMGVLNVIYIHHTFSECWEQTANLKETEARHLQSQVSTAEILRSRVKELEELCITTAVSAATPAPSVTGALFPAVGALHRQLRAVQACPTTRTSIPSPGLRRPRRS